MSKPSVKFNKDDQPEFYRELRTRVNNYFKEKNISKHANFQMVFKSIFMLFLYFTPLVLMLTGVVTSLWPVLFMWVLMGFGMSGIGLSVMHDANHGSYSSNPKVNKAVGFVINFIGGFHANWIIQHNVLHHSYTNVHGHDEDIDKGVMRFSPNQEPKRIFRFQAFYAPLFYSIMTIYWFIAKDFEQLIRYNKKDLLVGQGLTFTSALVQIIFHKIWYVGLMLVLPFMLIPLAWGQILLGFLIMHFICGLILALIFQPAHVIEATNFYVADDQGSVENSWAVHQLKTTSNFANDSVFFSWFVGGLNYQIEHHLFPTICHVHYKGISAIVKQTAEEYNIPYHHHKTFYGAVKSHFSLLNDLGNGNYDKKLAESLKTA
ncbi:MAG: linoleoyl-CoA desaturase [Saprospiraceae bacterium]|jgi:linoleoyl-CoA desaturase